MSRIEGTNHIIESIGNIADVQKLEQLMGQACAIVERAAKEKAPKDTGDVRRSITSKVEVIDDYMTGMV